MNTYQSPAKINLFLHNLGKRSDGYHELETVFILLDFYDEITIEKTTTGVISRISGNEDIAECDDLLIKAAVLLQTTTQTTFGANISIVKKIPQGGGLGGGSSNAATVLLTLNEIWQTGLSNQQLQQLGAKLGADVPIFVYGNHAFATGIGEKLTPVPIPQKYYLVVCPQCHSSTQQIFSHFALTTSLKQGKIPTFLQAIHLGNDCLDAAVNVHPEIGKSLDYLNSTKGRLSKAKLSGTGSCVFAIYQDKKSCQIALNNLHLLDCKKGNAFIAKSI
jgi:4-diphosphocytidyl-2-C-methyl-D-erythritol kinase